MVLEMHTRIRRLAGGLALVALPCLVAAGEKKADKAPKAEPRPAVRTVQVKDDIVQFNVRMTPGVPEPGQVVEARIEMNELPPVPDPVYGEQIPIKDAKLTLDVTDAKGEGYTLRYLVHPLADAGAYGLHFTPNRKDVYRLVIRGVHHTRKLAGTFYLPAGIWPFEDPGGSKSAASGRPASRLPALPTGMGPAVPASPAGPADPETPAGASPGGEPAKAAGSPLHQAMEKLGQKWVDLQVALFAGRRLDADKAALAASGLQQVSTVASAIETPQLGYAESMRELAAAAGELGTAVKSGKRGTIQTKLRKVGEGCNRCHFAARWKVLEDPMHYPDGLR
ncbi:MAG: hypothetical protein JXR96_06425 [Deltaproteobacteria bacterium]|nr:hypothetical protein [Deltaproteobacteria bacterium]